MSENNVFTPYAASVLANAALKAAGLPPIPSQMMYNYTTAKLRAGKKPLIAYTPEAGVDRTDFDRWLKSYLTKKGAAQATVQDPEQYAFDTTEAH
jgi:hypothetical protein